jgi:hypothetical protein
VAAGGHGEAPGHEVPNDSSGLVGRSESSVTGFTSFRCNITNYYFYFRLIAFVNLVILLQGNENADRGAGIRAARHEIESGI